MFERLEERLLQHIQRGIVIAREPVCQSRNPIPVPEVQSLESGCITAIDGGDELGVGPSLRVLAGCQPLRFTQAYGLRLGPAAQAIK